MAKWKLIENSHYSISDEGVVRNDETGKTLSSSRLDSKGYSYVTIAINGNYKNCRIHRLVGEAFLGESGIYDHIDNNRQNNNLSNLRCASHLENCMNSPSRKGSSKYKGVSYRPDKGKYRARITLFGKEVQIGTFESEEEAAIAYNKVAYKNFGEFAYLNEVENEGLQVANKE